MAARTPVLVPDIGDFHDVEVIEVLVKAGDTVALEAPLITLERVSTGSPIVVVETAAAAAPTAPAVKTPAPAATKAPAATEAGAAATLEVRVPRTRSGEFRPASLPSPYRRGYGPEVESLLLGMLGSSRSINAAKDALRKMGLSSSQQDLDRVALGLIEAP